MHKIIELSNECYTQGHTNSSVTTNNISVTQTIKIY